MAYIAPIHRASSIRHAIKLNFFTPEDDCLVLAKANRLEFHVHSPDGLALQHSRAIYGKITMLQKLRPTSSPTDHLFVGTDRFMFFTLSWDPKRKTLVTEKKFESVTDNAARESQTGERCHIDPSGRFMTLEVYEGIVTVIPLVQRGKKRKQEPDVAQIGEPQPVRITEMFVRSSTFLQPRSHDDKPKLALLFEDNHSNVRLNIREVAFGSVPDTIEMEPGESYPDNLDMVPSHLIPINEPTYGLVVLGETSIGYYDDSTNEILKQPLNEETIFVAWERIDHQRFALADDYGRLYLFMLDLNDHNKVIGWKLDVVGHTSRASTLVYLDAGYLFVGSHQGNSQLIRIGDKTMKVEQEFANIAPILDFTIMDMGNRTSEGQGNEYSSGQARIVTGSGAFQDGSLRSVRSGVGLEDLGSLGEMEHVSNLFSLNSTAASDFVDTLLVSFINESRIFRFDGQGQVEELDEFGGMSFSEATLVALNLSHGRLLQVTSSRVQITDLDGGVVISEWTPSNGHTISAASATETHVLLSLGGVNIVVLSAEHGLQVNAEKLFGADQQVACIALSSSSPQICFLGFWQNSVVSICHLPTLETVGTVNVSDNVVPRSLLLTQIFQDEAPTLFVALADGNVVTYSLDLSNYKLSGRKSIILGTREATFRALPRGNGLFNVLATCDHPSLCYASEGRLMYSAVTAEDATVVCPFNAEAYPGAVAIGTPEELKIALVDTERTTHIQTLTVNETVRRIAYSPSLKSFGLGTIKRILKGGEEILISSFKLVDEIVFKELDTYSLNEDELVESVMRCELNDGTGSLAERFVIGTAYLDSQMAVAHRGRLLILEVTEDRRLKLVTEKALKGGCRCLAMCNGNIVAALIKAVVIYRFSYNSPGTPDLEKLASFRCSTAPIDMTVNGDLITIGDLMKSLVVVQHIPGQNGLSDTIVEVARHYQTMWSTAVAEVDKDMYLQSDAEGNLIVLQRNPNGVTDDDKRRLIASAEMRLGEMVNRIRRIDVLTAPGAVVIPRAFMATVEGSLFLFGLISPDYQNTLITLQTRLAELTESPGDVPYEKFRSFKSQVRESEEPYRFVDADLVERFLELPEEMQAEAVKGVGMGVEDVKAMIEGLRRLR